MKMTPLLLFAGAVLFGIDAHLVASPQILAVLSLVCLLLGFTLAIWNTRESTSPVIPLLGGLLICVGFSHLYVPDRLHMSLTAYILYLGGTLPLCVAAGCLLGVWSANTWLSRNWKRPDWKVLRRYLEPALLAVSTVFFGLAVLAGLRPELVTMVCVLAAIALLELLVSIIGRESIRKGTVVTARCLYTGALASGMVTAAFLWAAFTCSTPIQVVYIVIALAAFLWSDYLSWPFYLQHYARNLYPITDKF